MANVNFRDVFWRVRTELPGVPVPLLFSQYVDSVREFLSRSKAWQHNCPNALDLSASTDWPTLSEGTDIPDSTYVVEPVQVKWEDGRIITFQTRDQLDEIDGDWEQATAAIPDYWTITGPGAWRVYPLLSTSVTESIYLRVALAPKVSTAETAAGIPEYLAYEFQSGWDAGALARLMRIPGKDWTDPRAAQEYAAQFEDAITSAKSRAAADFGRPRRTVRYGGLAIGTTRDRGRDDYGR